MGMSAASDALYRRDPNVITAIIDDELVMMSIEKGQYYGVSGVGPRVWELLVDPITVEQVSSVISCEYDIDVQSCQHDVESFIDRMVGIGVVSAVYE
jgi:hypothetical protein